ncbi:MAG: DM13 domain-containing protein [Bacteroidota bacterium]
MNGPKLFSILAIILVSCIGTDIVEDEVAQISIVVPPDIPFANNTTARVEGQEWNLTISALNDRGSSFTTEGTWFSADENVVSVDDKGIAKAIGEGSALVMASAFGIESEPIRFTVVQNNIEVALIEITADTSALSVNSQLQLEARAMTATGAEVTEAPISWRSLNEAIVTVTTEGLVTGLGNGVAEIEARLENINATFQLTVGNAASRMGQFESLKGYSTSGSVSVMSNGNRLSVNLESNFRTSNGPGLYVYLSNNRSSVSGGIELGKLTSTTGASAYSTPEGIALDSFDYVIIYCKPFGAGFGTASLD